MTAPQTSAAGTVADATSSTVLLELGKISTQLAVMDERLKGLSVPVNDHEGRIRTLERNQTSAGSVESYRRQSKAALWTAVASMAGAISAVVSAIALHH